MHSVDTYRGGGAGGRGRGGTGGRGKVSVHQNDNVSVDVFTFFSYFLIFPPSIIGTANYTYSKMANILIKIVQV